jgi:hypothetical protein
MLKYEYNEKINLRLPENLKERIVKLSKTYERSTNEQIVYMLKTWQEPYVLEERLKKLEEQVFQSKP